MVPQRGYFALELLNSVLQDSSTALGTADVVLAVVLAFDDTRAATGSLTVALWTRTSASRFPYET